MSELPLDGAPKEKHIIDKVADFLVYKGIKRAGAKGLAANWFKLFGEPVLAGALRSAEVAPNVGNYPAYMAAIMKANTEPPESAPQSQTIAPERAETPISRPKRPTPEMLYRERDRLVRQWREANADRLEGLDQDTRWYADRRIADNAWIQAQRNLLDNQNGTADLTPEEWKDVVDRYQ